MKIIPDHVIRLAQGNPNFTKTNDITFWNIVFRQ